MRISKEETIQLSIRNELGETIYLKTYEKWENLRILQEQGGMYAIVDSKGEASEFYYENIIIKQHYVFAYFQAGPNFHIYDKNGAILREENEILIAKKQLEEIQDLLLIETQDNMKAVIKGQNVKNFKKVSFIKCFDQFIGIIGIDLKGQLGLYNMTSNVHQYLETSYQDYEIKKMEDFSYVWGKRIGVKLAIQLKGKNLQYIVSFQVDKDSNIYQEGKKIIFEKLKIVKLQHNIINWLIHDERYVLCDGDSNVILYDLYKNRYLIPSKKANEAEIIESEIYFIWDNMHTEIYNEEFEKKVELEENLLAERILNGVWVAKEIFDFQNIKNYYVLTEKQCMHLGKGWFDHYGSYFVSANQAECKLIWNSNGNLYLVDLLSKHDECMYGNSNMFIMRSIDNIYFNFYRIYFEDIKVKKGMIWAYSHDLLHLQKSIEKGQQIELDENGFLTIPGLNKNFFIDRVEKRAYSVYTLRYWREKRKAKRK